MKKILLLAVVLFASLNANAQFYVGGSVGFGSVKPIGGGDSEFVFKILPELGYNLNDKWAVGAVLGYQKGFPYEGQNLGQGDFTQSQFSKAEVFTIAPYARYTAFDWDQVKLFIDGGISFGSIKDSGTTFSLGFRPGLAINLTEQVSFVTHLGFFGFENFSPKGEGKSGTNFGLDFANNCSFGVYYNF
jgi:hypothetical protein